MVPTSIPANSRPTAARLRLAPFGYLPAARPVSWETVSAIPMESEMILRTWRGSVDAENGDRYFAYLQETGIREYKATPGNRGVFVVRRERNGRTEYLLLTLWDSMDAVKRFAGDTPETAVFYPEDDGFLVERDEHVDHYEVLEAPGGAVT